MTGGIVPKKELELDKLKKEQKRQRDDRGSRTRKEIKERKEERKRMDVARSNKRISRGWDDSKQVRRARHDAKKVN